MEEIIVRAEELRTLVHEIKYTSQDIIVKVRKLNEETLKICEELSNKAHALLENLDTLVEHIIIKNKGEE